MAFCEKILPGLIGHHPFDRLVMIRTYAVVGEMLNHPVEMGWLRLRAHYEIPLSELPRRKDGVDQPAAVSGTKIDEDQLLTRGPDAVEHIDPFQELFIDSQAIGGFELLGGK